MGCLGGEPTASGNLSAGLLYSVAFVIGAIVMSFEILGSRYLNPYFGSGIYTWASLIAVVLAALAAGYFVGGWLADLTHSAAVLGSITAVGSAYLVLLPIFADPMLDFVLASVPDIRLGSLIASFAITFLPVSLLGMFSPFAIRILLRTTQSSGTVSGRVYGISTLGSIAGTLGTAFLLIPLVGTRTITIASGVAGMACGLLLILAERKAAKVVLMAAILVLGAVSQPTGATASDSFIDHPIRAAMLTQKDGAVAHMETVYNDIFITKHGDNLVMDFMRHGSGYTESITNLADDDDLPLRYTQVMTLGVAYVETPKNALMIGLGSGSIPVYLVRSMTELAVDVVELDPGVIAAARQYFGIRESGRLHIVESDGRVFLVRNRNPYDMILVDAFRGGYVPFHLLTREFYDLVKQRLTPGGAAIFNLHGGTKLYVSTLATLRAVFPSVDLYYANGNVIAVATVEPVENRRLTDRADALQKRYGFRFALPDLLATRSAWPEGPPGGLLTDDFAPVNLYDSIEESNKRQW
ncbi:MAG TPA: fused MFS/spermidine synthase [Telmatospirillum sp.]|nr:fused MFS/spermidine synthase [Telmatospirillum sp.]